MHLQPMYIFLGKPGWTWAAGVWLAQTLSLRARGAAEIKDSEHGGCFGVKWMLGAPSNAVWSQTIHSYLIFFFFFFPLSRSQIVCASHRVGERRGSKAGLRRTLLTTLVFWSEGRLQELWQSTKELDQGWLSEHPSGLFKLVFPGF